MTKGVVVCEDDDAVFNRVSHESRDTHIEDPQIDPRPKLLTEAITDRFLVWSTYRTMMHAFAS